MKKISYIMAALLFLCLLRMPYGYYELVRFLGMVYFFIQGQNAVKKEEKYFWYASAILINPIFKIHLGRFLWNVIDVFWGTVILVKKPQLKNIN